MDTKTLVTGIVATVMTVATAVQQVRVMWADQDTHAAKEVAQEAVKSRDAVVDDKVEVEKKLEEVKAAPAPTPNCDGDTIVRLKGALDRERSRAEKLQETLSNLSEGMCRSERRAPT